MVTNRQAVFTSFFGTTGDVAYLAGIAQGIQQADYTVRMILPKRFLNEYRPLLERMGINNVTCADPSSKTIEELMSTVQNMSKLSQLKFEKEYLKQRFSEVRVTIENLCNQKDEIRFIVGDVSSRRLIASARSAGIPYIQASPMPYVPTSNFYLDSRFPCVNKFGWFNLLRWNRGSTPINWIRSFLRTFFNPRISRKNRDFKQYYRNELPHIISASPVLIPRASDWGDNVHILGYTPWDTSKFPIPDGLSEFIAAGEPPIFVGFGSYVMKRFSGKKGKRFLHALADAASSLGQRLVFYSTGSKISNEQDLPKDVFLVGNISHDWLFPKCKAVICHGGYGTIHSALKAHKPLIIYPYQTDQFLLASRMEILGVSPPYKATFDKVGVRQFFRDLTQLCENIAVMNKKAKEIGELIQSEDAVKNHVSAIRNIIGET